MSLFRRNATSPAPTDRGVQSAAGAANPSEQTEVVGERGIPSVNRSRSLQSRLSSVLAIALICALGLGLLTWYYARALARPAQSQQRAQAEVANRARGEMALPSLGKIQQPLSPLMQSILGKEPPLPPGAPPRWARPARDEPLDMTLTSAHASAAAGITGRSSLQRKLAGPVLVESAARGPTFPVTIDEDSAESAKEEAATPVALDGENSNGGRSRRSTRESTLAQHLDPTATAAERARVLATQRFLLSKGTFIDCTLETAIDSTLPGLTTCITATDTFGANGEVVLLERGSKLLGETQGQVQQGAARLFVLWSEARTPTGVVIPLASPGTDALGRAGVAGKMQRHFWDRFGAAILISIIDGAVQLATQRSNDGTSVIVSPNTSRDLASEVLRSRLNIPPTLAKPQGERIQVLVARDVDFRSVYELRVAAAVR